MVIELKEFDVDRFTFKWSPDVNDYNKCQNSKCKKVGIFEHFKCICGKVVYCSQNCCDTDTVHQDKCEVWIKD